MNALWVILLEEKKEIVVLYLAERESGRVET